MCTLSNLENYNEQENKYHSNAETVINERQMDIKVLQVYKKLNLKTWDSL